MLLIEKNIAIVFVRLQTIQEANVSIPQVYKYENITYFVAQMAMVLY